MNTSEQKKEEISQNNQSVIDSAQIDLPSPQSAEDVDKSIDEVVADKKKRKNEQELTGLQKIFQPLKVALGKLKRIKIGITIRVTALYLLMTAIALAAISVVVLTNVEQFLREHEVVGADLFLFNLRFITVVVSVALLAAVCTVGYVSAYFTLAPIRRMLKSIRQITSENLSMRLEEAKGETELKELAIEINKLLQDLEETLDRQRKFVSNVSHEFRTPITVIKGQARLLLRWGKNDPALLEEGLRDIATEAENLQAIAEQSLKLVNYGRYQPIVKSVDCVSLLQGIADSYVTEKKNVSFAPETAELTVSTDAALLTECVRALVDNAVKYSPVGSPVTISCKQEDGKIKISVKDEGVGIAKEEVPKIFDRFYRCDTVRKRENGGYGLGLAICAAIVEALKGEIGVQTELGKGSEFTIVLGG